MGNDLNSLLPIEYCYLADDSLRAVFMERYAEKRLQLFDYKSKEADPVKNDKQKVSGQGPYIICVDTSGSMQGDREILARQLNISPQQMKYVTHTEAGEGLIFYGNVVLPFVDRFPKDTELYRVMTTKPEEIQKDE